MLDIVAHFLRTALRTLPFIRLDGATGVALRQSLVADFNGLSGTAESEENQRPFLFLLTTRVGGVGLNLAAADRVLLLDPDWNPSVDAQAMERAFRIGQTRDVAVYRLVTRGTIEEKVHERQVYKQVLSSRILEDPRQRRVFDFEALHDLFAYCPKTSENFESFGENKGNLSKNDINFDKNDKYIAKNSAKKYEKTAQNGENTVKPIGKRVKQALNTKSVKNNNKITKNSPKLSKYDQLDCLKTENKTEGVFSGERRVLNALLSNQHICESVRHENVFDEAKLEGLRERGIEAVDRSRQNAWNSVNRWFFGVSKFKAEKNDKHIIKNDIKTDENRLINGKNQLTIIKNIKKSAEKDKIAKKETERFKMEEKPDWNVKRVGELANVLTSGFAEVEVMSSNAVQRVFSGLLLNDFDKFAVKYLMKKVCGFKRVGEKVVWWHKVKFSVYFFFAFFDGFLANFDHFRWLCNFFIYIVVIFCY